MADVTQNTFDETKRYDKVIFQRGRNVLDSELNELQDDTRIMLYRQLQAILGTTDLTVRNAVSFAVTGGSNQITVAGGVGSAYGYIISQTGSINVSGLTTPGGARTDCVWLSISESEIDSATDPAIAAAALGETTRRAKLVIGWGVTENSLVTPATTGEPWAGGTVYIRVALLSRTASATITSAMIYDRRRLFRDYLGGLTSDFSPVASYLYDDVATSNIDRFGFQGFGPVGNLREDWSWKSFSGSSDYAARNYVFTTNGTGTAIRATPFSEFGTGIFINCAVAETAGKYVQVLQNPFTKPNTKILFAIEWSIAYAGSVGAGFGAATTTTFRCGLSNSLTSGVPTASAGAAYFEWAGPTNAQWLASVIDGSGATGSYTGVGPGTASRHFRIEIIGSAADSIAADRVNFYIDNVLVVSNTLSFPTLGLGFFFSAVANGTVVDDVMLVSDVRSAWRRFVTPSKR